MTIAYKNLPDALIAKLGCNAHNISSRNLSRGIRCIAFPAFSGREPMHDPRGTCVPQLEDHAIAVSPAILGGAVEIPGSVHGQSANGRRAVRHAIEVVQRSEEHTSELQSL